MLHIAQAASHQMFLDFRPDLLPGEEDIQTLEDVKRDHVLWVYHQCNGNKREAANLLGVERSTLYRMLAGWGVI